MSSLTVYEGLVFFKVILPRNIFLLKRNNFVCEKILCWEHLKKENLQDNDMISRAAPLKRRSSIQIIRKNRPCNHCKLIDSGDVALYQITCPECGEVPPSRKRSLYPGMSSTNVQKKS